MEPDDKFAAVDLSIFREIKMLSGERIRHERNLRGITQLQLATIWAAVRAGCARSKPARR